jgi:hypothetical protein
MVSSGTLGGGLVVGRARAAGTAFGFAGSVKRVKLEPVGGQSLLQNPEEVVVGEQSTVAARTQFDVDLVSRPNTKQAIKAREALSDPDLLQAALDDIGYRAEGPAPSSVTKSRVNRYVDFVSSAGEVPMPMTERKAAIFVAGLVVGGYRTCDNYFEDALAYLRQVEGGCEMSEAEVSYIRSLIRRQARTGAFDHTPARAALLDDVDAWELPEEQEPFRSTAYLAFLFGLRGRSELSQVDFKKDCRFVAADNLFCLDLSHLVLKSNHTKKIYVRCLCSDPDAYHVCPHHHVDRAKTDGFVSFFEGVFGPRTHSLRIGCLCHLLSAGVVHHRVCLHLRWLGEEMLLYYGQASEYRLSKYRQLVFTA